jgi:hypothetical protein
LDYKVEPGLYSVGEPDSASPVLVSANYKLTFDTLRYNLAGINCWLLILDTKGINVWCAAGKGTFSTAELVSRIDSSGLSEVVKHRRLILPQLGASGINGNEVARRSGFSVTFGPVRAGDVKKYIANGFTATQDMRTVRFTTKDRLVLTPIEVIASAKPLLMAFGAMFLVNLFASRPFGVEDFAVIVGAVLAGTVVTPLLLPVVPGAAFSWKGALVGLAWALAAVWGFGWLSPEHWALAVGYILLLPSVSAYHAMKFTGCSTFTSPSGVLKEMKTALPVIAASAVFGVALVLFKTVFGD